MAKHYKATRVKETKYVINAGTGELDRKLYTTTYDGKSYGSNHRGGFVYSIFILVCCFLVFLGVYGFSTHDNPMDLIIQSANIVSEYGENSFNDIKQLKSSIDYLKFQIDSDDFSIPSDQVVSYVNEDFGFWVLKFKNKVQDFLNNNSNLGIYKFLVNVYNSFVNIVNFLIIVPYAIGRYAVGILVVLFRIIYVFIV